MNTNKEPVCENIAIEALPIDLLEWVNGGLKQEINLSEGLMCVFWTGGAGPF